MWIYIFLELKVAPEILIVQILLPFQTTLIQQRYCSWLVSLNYRTYGIEGKIVRKVYYRKDACYLNPDKQTSSFRVTSSGMQFFNDDLCTIPFGFLQTYVANKWFQNPHKFRKMFKRIDWSAHEVDDSINSFLRVYVPGHRHHGCNGPYFVEHWTETDCLPHPMHANIW